MRGWHELVALVGDGVPGGVPVLGTGLALLTLLVMLLWYWFPEWLNGLVATVRRIWRALRGLRLPRWRRHRGKPAGPEEAPEPAAVADPLPDDDELPALPAAALALSADELAAQGRFKEAVRERLRAIVRDLVDRGVITHRPGWTVTELAQMAGQARPAAAPPLHGASEVFSQIWYGQRAATAAHDQAMRGHAAAVRAAIDDRVPA